MFKRLNGSVLIHSPTAATVNVIKGTLFASSSSSFFIVFFNLFFLSTPEELPTSVTRFRMFQVCFAIHKYVFQRPAAGHRTVTGVASCSSEFSRYKHQVATPLHLTMQVQTYQPKVKLYNTFQASMRHLVTKRSIAPTFHRDDVES